MSLHSFTLPLHSLPIIQCIFCFRPLVGGQTFYGDSDKPADSHCSMICYVVRKLELKSAMCWDCGNYCYYYPPFHPGVYCTAPFHPPPALIPYGDCFGFSTTLYAKPIDHGIWREGPQEEKVIKSTKTESASEKLDEKYKINYPKCEVCHEEIQDVENAIDVIFANPTRLGYYCSLPCYDVDFCEETDVDQ